MVHLRVSLAMMMVLDWVSIALNLTIEVLDWALMVFDLTSIECDFAMGVFNLALMVFCVKVSLGFGG